MSKSKDLVLNSKEGHAPSTREVLGQTIQGIVEGLTGLAASDKKDLLRSAGFILQKWRAVKLLDAFTDEWNRYRDRGRVKDDYLATEQHAECLQELLDFLDQPAPDRARFDALKKILLVSATEAHSSRESVLPQQYMKLVRELGSSELLVLLTAYTLAGRSSDEHVLVWAQEIANASGLKLPELVLRGEKKLIDGRLINDHYPGRPGSSFRGANNRLTDLGYQLCDFISKYSE